MESHNKKTREEEMLNASADMMNILLPVDQRKKARKKQLELLLNPITDFNPETFNPLGTENDEVMNRERVDPPKRLPTLGLRPQKLLEGQLVGMYESKQQLYLLIAWLSERVTDLEEQLNNQKK